MIRYLITNGRAATDERRWLNHLAVWMEDGVDFIQIRERDLNARRLAELTRKVLRRRGPFRTKVLVNDRADIAVACGADGVHARDGAPVLESTISASCHSLSAIHGAGGARYILLAPIFAPLSKDSTEPLLGVETIALAAQIISTPILALGGVTCANERECIEAGAAGIAGISYFEKMPA